MTGWSYDEDMALRRAVEKYGSRWKRIKGAAEFAEVFQERDARALKNRWQRVGYLYESEIEHLMTPEKRLQNKTKSIRRKLKQEAKKENKKSKSSSSTRFRIEDFKKLLLAELNRFDPDHLSLDDNELAQAIEQTEHACEQMQIKKQKFQKTSKAKGKAFMNTERYHNRVAKLERNTLLVSQLCTQLTSLAETRVTMQQKSKSLALKLKTMTGKIDFIEEKRKRLQEEEEKEIISKETFEEKNAKLDEKQASLIEHQSQSLKKIAAITAALDFQSYTTHQSSE